MHNENNNVWVFAEQNGGQIVPVVFEILTEARTIAEKLGVGLSAVLMGHEIADQAEALLAYGAQTVYVCDAPVFKEYTTAAVTQQLAVLIGQYAPAVLFIGATHNGRDLGPRLASRLNTGLTADCTSLDVDLEKGDLLMTRPAFGGNLMATIVCPSHRPQMATVRPGVFKAIPATPPSNAQVVTVPPQILPEACRTEVLRIVKEKSGEEDIARANIIVAGGGIAFVVLQLLGQALIQIGGAEPPFTASADEILAFCEMYRQFEQKVPLVVVPSTYCSITEDELRKAGVRVVIYANQLIRSAYPAMVEAAKSILENERALECSSLCMPIKEILTLIPGGK
jgi:hypothetical protein